VTSEGGGLSDRLDRLPALPSKDIQATQDF